MMVDDASDGDVVDDACDDEDKDAALDTADEDAAPVDEERAEDIPALLAKEDDATDVEENDAVLEAAAEVDEAGALDAPPTELACGAAEDAPAEAPLPDAGTTAAGPHESPSPQGCAHTPAVPQTSPWRQSSSEEHRNFTNSQPKNATALAAARAMQWRPDLITPSS